MVTRNIKPLVSIANVSFHLKMQTFKIMDANGTGVNGLFVQSVIDKMTYLVVVRLNSISFKIDFL